MRRRAARRRGRQRGQALIGQRVMNHHYNGLRTLQALPGRLVAAVPRGSTVYGAPATAATRRTWGSRQHAGAAARRAVVRRGRRGLVRDRHRLRRAAAPGRLRPRHAGDLRPGSGRPQRHDARPRRWARASSPSTSPRSDWRWPSSSAPSARSTRARPIPSRAIHDLTHGEGAERTLDCSGLPRAARRTPCAARGTWGRVCFVGEGNDVTLRDQPGHDPQAAHACTRSWTFSRWARRNARTSSSTARCRSAALHPTLESGPGRGGLQAVRHADHRQGRLRLLAEDLLQHVHTLVDDALGGLAGGGPADTRGVSRKSTSAVCPGCTWICRVSVEYRGCVTRRR